MGAIPTCAGPVVILVSNLSPLRTQVQVQSRGCIRSLAVAGFAVRDLGLCGLLRVSRVTGLQF